MASLKQHTGVEGEGVTLAATEQRRPKVVSSASLSCQWAAPARPVPGYLSSTVRGQWTPPHHLLQSTKECALHRKETVMKKVRRTCHR